MLIKFITVWTCESEPSPATFFYAPHCTHSQDQVLTPEAQARLSVKPKRPTHKTVEAEFGLLNLWKHKYYPQSGGPLQKHVLSRWFPLQSCHCPPPAHCPLLVLAMVPQHLLPVLEVKAHCSLLATWTAAQSSPPLLQAGAQCPPAPPFYWPNRSSPLWPESQLQPPLLADAHPGLSPQR